MNEKELTIRIAVFLLGSVGIGLLARRKNHNPWLWGGIGGAAALVMPILILVPLLIVGALKYRCAKCGSTLSNADGKAGACAACAASSPSPTAGGAV
jgi:hypothetical protein